MLTKYISAPAVCARYDVTHMTLWRWLRDPALAFPQPIIINRRRFFDLEQLEAWERTRAATHGKAA